MYYLINSKVQEQINWKTADSTLHQNMGQVGQAVSHKPNQLVRREQIHSSALLALLGLSCNPLVISGD